MRFPVLLFLTATSFAALIALTVPGEWPLWAPTFQREGLPGFVQLPSVLALHVGAAVAWIVLQSFGFAEAERRQHVAARRALKVSSVLLLLGGMGYLLSIAGIAWVSRAGMFGLGPAGLLAILVLFPSLLLLGATAVLSLTGYALLIFRN